MNRIAAVAISFLLGAGASFGAAAQSAADVLGTWLFVSSVRDSERYTFQNGDGTVQKRSFTLIADVLHYVIPLPTGGASVVTWRRAK